MKNANFQFKQIIDYNFTAMLTPVYSSPGNYSLFLNGPYFLIDEKRNVGYQVSTLLEKYVFDREFIEELLSSYEAMQARQKS